MFPPPPPPRLQMNSFGTEGENEGEKKEENEVMKSAREGEQKERRQTEEMWETERWR